MKHLTLKAAILGSVLFLPSVAGAQTSATEAAETTAVAATEEALLTAEELQTLVGPVALYPDTLLIQILVAATFPLDVMKADRLIKDNEGVEPEALKETIDAQGWDESVAVLAAAFPDVLADMAEHVDWTDTIGTAMLAQSDDVMVAVQNRREVANASGVLVSGDEQTVEVTKGASGEEAIVIQPTDPEIVYVPQYDSNVVYVQESNSTNDVLTAGLIGFGSYLVLDAIFDNNDPWNDYWGCRNCGGWGGGPIYRNPNIDIGVDGNVNIGNKIGNNNGNNLGKNNGDRSRAGNFGGWQPDERRKKDAQKKITNKRGPNGATTLPAKTPNRGDDMRANLAKSTGTKDISRVQKPRDAVAKSKRPAGAAKVGTANKKAAVNRTGAPPTRDGAKAKAGGANKAKATKKKAAIQKPKAAKKPRAKPAAKKNTAMKKRPSSHSAKSGKARGKAASGGRRR
ncbi:DUF3300 domain-containing protein [Falsihalocynthiibacter sp. BN13B15]|uniref:DUF3300 domain-containing protein n=1 Tax=Falsihalocynthiibacter sp. BN13B15 TaxID=3240871 RepID=UPI00350F6660